MSVFTSTEIRVCLEEARIPPPTQDSILERLNQLAASQMLMPFGKYKDAPVPEVAKNDPRYLKWLMKQPDFEVEHAGLFDAVRQALQ